MLTSTVLFALIAAVSARQCHDVIIPVSLTAQNLVLDIQAPLTKIDVSNLILNLAQQGRIYTEVVAKGMANITGDYQLGGTYCEPDAGPGRELQILTHGLGFDRTYWDIAANNYNYSYVAQAVDQSGYSTFAWDRLGVGASSKGDPVKEIQVFLEIAALKELTTLFRAGQIEGVSCPATKIIHVGHSFGSVISYGLTNMYPELSDAIVLTGFSQTNAFMGGFALANNFIPITNVPTLAAKYPPGYIATESDVGVQLSFFASGDFDPALLELAYQTGQPATPGELLSIGAPAAGPSAFKGRVLIITGEHDIPFCGGNCFATESVNASLHSLLDISKPMFPKASVFNTSVVPGAGHGLNYQYSHTFTYNTILNFLSE
ncbi:hypothetical protein G7046_g5099 [Stylonectria norvegica]|nr:hypothetical protein G7046_g5099 [Stylonectria norvegica]